jgi:hypothetical protein
MAGEQARKENNKDQQRSQWRFVLKTEAVDSFETPTNFYQIILRQIQIPVRLRFLLPVTITEVLGIHTSSGAGEL